MSSKPLPLKVSINGTETRRLSLNAPITFARLVELLTPMAGGRTFTLSYVDDEGESVSVCTDACLKEAVAIMEKMELKALKLTIKTNAAPVEEIKESIPPKEAPPKDYAEEEKSFRASLEYLTAQFAPLQTRPESVGPEILGLVSILHKHIERIENNSIPTWAEVVREIQIVAPKISALPCFKKPESQNFLDHLEVVAKFLASNLESASLYQLPPHLAPLMFCKSEKVLKSMATISGMPPQLALILDNFAGLVNSLNVESVDESQDEKRGPSVHEGVRCDVCDVLPIVGSRFKCTVCHNYDLCEKCEASGAHPPEHEMIKFKTPKRHGGRWHGGGFRPPRHGFPPVDGPFDGPGFGRPMGFGGAMGGPEFGGPAPEDGPVHHHPPRRWRNSQFGRRNWANVAETSPAPAYVSPHTPAPAAAPAPLLKEGLSAKFLADVNIPDGKVLDQGTVHIKTWSIQNDSLLGWDESVKLVYVSGNVEILLDRQLEYSVPALRSGATGDVLVPIVVPFQPASFKTPAAAKYKTVFRFQKDGEFFGDSIWVEFSAI